MTVPVFFERCLLPVGRDSQRFKADNRGSATLLNLEKKLNSLIEWIQDGSLAPEQRFQLLQEIAEEAARYKLGGDDKIRVAGGACDGVSLAPPSG